ncbi:hypothetical protein BCONGLO52_06850 [Brachybacterium conglomeratum]|uniref:Uncharacterized protein n=1 Tax=Brachybacterium conglomeratum TaxID=47846 RepID=A0ABQ5RFE3_9MICO|nr:hypothetical protein BCONGLO52_06850 [Brachybacterium conglomeratum]GLK05979.1 hypothetical protein GCM10017597_27790 [Brachybacterium conglomeratum]
MSLPHGAPARSGAPRSRRRASRARTSSWCWATPSTTPRFGFTPASGVGVTAPFDVPDEAFLALALDPERPTPRGQIAYPPAFGV